MLNSEHVQSTFLSQLTGSPPHMCTHHTILGLYSSISYLKTIMSTVVWAPEHLNSEIKHWNPVSPPLPPFNSRIYHWLSQSSCKDKACRAPRHPKGSPHQLEHILAHKQHNYGGGECEVWVQGGEHAFFALQTLTYFCRGKLSALLFCLTVTGNDHRAIQNTSIQI